MRLVSLKASSAIHQPRKVTLIFDKIQPSELADQLTVLEYKTFCRITVGVIS